MQAIKNSKFDPISPMKFITFFSFCFRFGSVVCSVVALKQVAVSFSETIKSSAPLFTVVTAYLILGKYMYLMFTNHTRIANWHNLHLNLVNEQG